MPKPTNTKQTNLDRFKREDILEWASLAFVAGQAKRLAQTFNDALGIKFFQDMTLQNVYKSVEQDVSIGRDIVILLAPDIRHTLADGYPYKTRLAVSRNTITKRVEAKIHTRFGTTLDITLENNIPRVARILYDICEDEKQRVGDMVAFAQDEYLDNGHQLVK